MVPAINPNVRITFFIKSSCFLPQRSAAPGSPSSSVRVILRMSSFRLRDQTEVACLLHGLGPPSDVHFVEQPGGVRLHRVLRDEEFLADLTVAEPLGDEA